MAQGTFSRKLDSMGRIMIPIKLREQLNLTVGKEYQFMIKEINGRNYICIDCGSALSSLDEAMRVVKEAGYNISE